MKRSVKRNNNLIPVIRSGPWREKRKTRLALRDLMLRRLGRSKSRIIHNETRNLEHCGWAYADRINQEYDRSCMAHRCNSRLCPSCEDFRSRTHYNRVIEHVGRSRTDEIGMLTIKGHSCPALATHELHIHPGLPEAIEDLKSSFRWLRRRDCFTLSRKNILGAFTKGVWSIQMAFRAKEDRWDVHQHTITVGAPSARQLEVMRNSWMHRTGLEDETCFHWEPIRSSLTNAAAYITMGLANAFVPAELRKGQTKVAEMAVVYATKYRPALSQYLHVVRSPGRLFGTFG